MSLLDVFSFSTIDQSIMTTKEIDTLKRELKKKNGDYEDLKKIVTKLENERDQQRRLLDSRVPPDVQTLMNQKRELTMQLDREQNEKHELFLQINSLIAQVADRGNEEEEKEEKERLNKDIKALEERLKVERESVERKSQELELTVARNDIEKKKLIEEIESMEKELHMKSAALQSVMLAKQEVKDDSSRLLAERLKNELNEEQKESLRIKDELIKSSSIRNELEEKISIMENEMKLLEKKLDNSLRDTAEARGKINSSDQSRNELEERLRSIDIELYNRIENEKERADSLQRRLDMANGEKGQELTLLEGQLNELRNKEQSLQKESRDKDEKIRQISDSSSSEILSLRKSLDEAVSKSSHIVALETKIEVLQKEKEEIERKRREIEKQSEEDMAEMKRVQATRGDVHNELMTLVKSLKEERQQRDLLNVENGQLMKELNEAREENEQLQEECRLRDEEIIEWKERIERAEASSSSASLSIEEEKIKQREENEKLKKKYADLINEAEASQKAIEELEDEKQSILEDTKRREMKMESEIERAIADTNTSRAELTKMALRVKEMEADTRKHESRAEELQRRIDTLLEEGEKEKGVNAVVEAEKMNKMREAEEFSMKVKKQLEELERENAERLSEKETSHQSTVQKMTDQMEDLQSKLASNSSLLIQTESQLKKALHDLDEYKKRDEENKHKDNEIVKMESELYQTRTSTDSIKNELNELRNKFDLLSSEKISLEGTIERLENDIEILKKQIDEERKRPDYGSEVSQLRRDLALEVEEKERIERKKNEIEEELKNIIEEEKKRPNHDIELSQLRRDLAVEMEEKEKIVKLNKEIEEELRRKEKALEEEKKRPNHEAELVRLRRDLKLEIESKERIEKEKNELEYELKERNNEETKENGSSSPIAPPRKSRDSHSSSISSSIPSDIDSTDRVKVLESQLAKKDRIIGVLRRKIHQQQLALL